MLELLTLTRVVSTQDALDDAQIPDGAIVMRMAPDEALVLGEGTVAVNDAHAIVVADPGWRGAWVDAVDAAEFLSSECAWPLPTERPAFAQGMVAHMPVKLWLEDSRTLFVVPHVSATDFADLLGEYV